MIHPVDLAYLEISESDDPARVAMGAERAARHLTGRTDVIEATPRVAPPAAWVREHQRGPVVLAAWAAQHCDDLPTLESIVRTKPLRIRVLEALCANTHLSLQLRSTLRNRAGLSSYQDWCLWEATPFAERLIEFHRIVDDALAQDERGAELSSPEEADLRRVYRVLDDPRISPTELVAVSAKLVALGKHGLVCSLLRMDSIPAVQVAARDILDVLLPAFDWSLPTLDANPDEWPWPSSGDRYEGAKKYGVTVDDPAMYLLPRMDPVQMLELVVADVPYTAHEYAAVVANYLEAADDLPLDVSSNREYLAIQLDLEARIDVGWRRDAALCTVFTGSDDPLLTRTLPHVAHRSIVDFLEGNWWRVDATGKRIERLLPTNEHLEMVFTRFDDPSERPRWRRACTGAVRTHDEPHLLLPEAYRRRVLEVVPGAAADLIDDPQARTWIWEALTTATDRLDLALDQLEANPDTSLKVLCGVLSNLDKASRPTRVTGVHAVAVPT